MKNMGMGTHEVPKVENIDEYEREKIERTLLDAKRLVEVIANYLEMVKYCDEHGIKIKGRTLLDSLRYPDAPAGPNSDLDKLYRLFMNGQAEIAGNLTKEQADHIYREKIKPREKK